MTKILNLEIETCNQCPHCDAMSIDSVAHAYCKKTAKPLPVDGQDGLKIMCMEIPEWCPLQTKARGASHECKYEWTICQDCVGSGKDQYGNRCHGCEGKGKRSECAPCYAEMHRQNAEIL